VTDLSFGQNIQYRKKEHLNIVLDNDRSLENGVTGFEEYDFIHQALPEIDLSEVDTGIKLFGHNLATPFIISSMVGGIEEAKSINRHLAETAQILGLAMGVGSQRCGIDKPETISTYQVRDIAPDILLFANLGAIQLNNGYTIDQCRKAVEMIDANGLILHLNPLQEALQPEGNTNFKGLLSKIEKICRSIPVPVIVKEVGFGISEPVAVKLVEAGVAGIDIAGRGGTSFSKVERLRSTTIVSEEMTPFDTWGIRTAESLTLVRQAVPNLPVIASGGIRNGVEAAKAIALGADAVGMGGVLLKAATISSQKVIEFLNEIINQLRTVMFCTGTMRIEQLKGSPYLKHR
jgi:isopentenyl-diphosphate Delta-isomerase